MAFVRTRHARGLLRTSVGVLSTMRGLDARIRTAPSLPTQGGNVSLMAEVLDAQREGADAACEQTAGATPTEAACCALTRSAPRGRRPRASASRTEEARYALNQGATSWSPRMESVLRTAEG